MTFQRCLEKQPRKKLHGLTNDYIARVEFILGEYAIRFLKNTVLKDSFILYRG